MAERQFSYAELFAMYEAARTNHYRNDPERAEALASATERCLYLLLRRLARDDDNP